MKINLNFGQYVDIVELDSFLGNDISKYQQEFEKWYYEEEKTPYGKILKQRADLPYNEFTSQVFVDWVKKVSPCSKVNILNSNINPKKKDNLLPEICF